MSEAANYQDAERLDTDAPKSLVWVSAGDDGSGKSHFSLTAPSPTFVFAFDPYGMRRVAADVKRDKDIRISRYQFDPRPYHGDRKQIQTAAMDVWKRFRDEFDMALGHVRTGIIDREDMMFKLQRYANFGQLADAPKEYEPLYSEIGWLIQKAQGAGVNLGILRGIKEKWENKFDPQKGKMVPYSTGKMVPDGMRTIPTLADVTLHHRWDSEQKQFVVKIDKFTNPSEKDMEYPNLTFADMATLAYPETTEGDWQ